MSIASDIRAYAESAVGQGKATLSNAQASFNDIAGKANDAVHDLRVSAERAVNIDAIRSAVEPYLAQAKDYGTTVTDRADVWIGDIKGDPRFAKLVGTAGSVSGIVRDTVQEHVVKPVQSLTGRGGGAAPITGTAAAPASAPAPKPRPTAPKTATTTTTTTTTAAPPAAAAPTASATSATAKPAAAKPAATKATAAKTAAKSTAARTTAAKTTAAKTTAAKTTAAKTAAAKSAAAKAATEEANGKPTGEA